MPSRFRRQRVLIVGCGDVGLRVAALLLQRTRVLALTSSPGRVHALRGLGITALTGNLDAPATIARLAGLATRVIHLAPPPNHDASSRVDPRTSALARVLRQRTRPLALVYGSTSGVYGNCNGEWVDETRPVNPQTARAHRRVHAEATLRWFGQASGSSVHILRIPGIYAPDRDGGTPRERLQRGAPVLVDSEDVFTNHIHADDLARACVAALWRAKPQRITNVNDDSQLKMGAYFDMAADLYGLARPPRLSRAEAKLTLPAMQMSFMGESRRLVNKRLKQELRLKLRYPTASTGLL